MASAVGNIRDLLICPITYELLQDPVVDTCGHTFERIDITYWLSRCQSCPLSALPLRVEDLKPNHAVKDVLDVLAHHNSELDGLEEDEKERVNVGLDQISSRRAADAAAGILDRLPEGERRLSLATRIKNEVEGSLRGCFRC